MNLWPYDSTGRKDCFLEGNWLICGERARERERGRDELDRERWEKRESGIFYQENSHCCITGKLAGRCDDGVMQRLDSKAHHQTTHWRVQQVILDGYFSCYLELRTETAVLPTADSWPGMPLQTSNTNNQTLNCKFSICWIHDLKKKKEKKITTDNLG